VQEEWEAKEQNNYNTKYMAATALCPDGACCREIPLSSARAFIFFMSVLIYH